MKRLLFSCGGPCNGILKHILGIGKNILNVEQPKIILGNTEANNES